MVNCAIGCEPPSRVLDRSPPRFYELLTHWFYFLPSWRVLYGWIRGEIWYGERRRLVDVCFCWTSVRTTCAHLWHIFAHSVGADCGSVWEIVGVLAWTIKWFWQHFSEICWSDSAPPRGKWGMWVSVDAGLCQLSEILDNSETSWWWTGEALYWPTGRASL